MTVLVGGCTVISSSLASIQSLFLNRKIQETEIKEPPLFVVGHWRSGTTLLHEMLAQDERFGWPSTFECFVPTHFLLSRPVLNPLVKLLMPSKRPMDSMPAGAEYPQEDEFALIGLGAPTPYRHIAFCNDEPKYTGLLNLMDTPADQVEQVRDALTWFYKAQTYQKQKRLLLKSPTHTGRIGHLAKWFANAKFIHITRHPHKIFPSTVHLWKSLCKVQGYQYPKDDSKLVQYVNECYQQMYKGFFAQQEQIPDSHITHLQFEDLVKDPVGQLRSVYRDLDLGNFESVRPSVESFWAQRKSHRTNRTQLTPEVKEVIDDVWLEYMERFGYNLCPVE